MANIRTPLKRSTMMMRSLLCVLLVIGVGTIALAGQKKATKPSVSELKISAPGQGNWTRSQVTLTQLAQKVAAATMGLKNTTAEMRVDVTTPEGTAVFMTPSVALRIRDASHYRVDYVVIQKVPFSASLAFDGRSRRVRLDSELTTLKGTGKIPAALKVTGDRLVALFDIDFPRLAFQGLTEGVDAWKSVFMGWARGVDGYKPVVEERRMTYQGVKYLNYRILVQRTGPAKAKLGVSTFEVVLDGKRFLPVTIRNVRTDAKGGKWSAQWVAAYKFNQKLTDVDFKLGS